MPILPPSRPLRTLVVSAPGVMEDSLRALLASFPQIEIVGTAAGCLTAYNLVQDLTPDLVVIDASHPESEVISLLHSFEGAHLHPSTIIFVNAPSQQMRVRQAGADHVFLRSGSPESLSRALANLHAVKQRAA